MAEHTVRAYDGHDGRYLHVDDVCRMLRELATVAESSAMGVLYEPMLTKLAETFESYRTTPTNPVDYDGPDETVPCAWPPCDRHLRRSASGDGRQWCSKEHRSMSEATADG